MSRNFAFGGFDGFTIYVDNTSPSVASIKQNGEQVKIVPLEPTDEASRFSARFTAGSRGAYEVAVTAFDPASGNAGADFSAITVE